MNQSVALYNLPLATDIIHHVCSFLYYTEQESIQRNKQKYKRVLRDFKRIYFDRMNTWGPTFVTRVNIFIILPTRTLIVANICTRCNNYVKNFPKKHFICQCIV